MVILGFLCMGKNRPEPPLAEPPSAENRVNVSGLKPTFQVEKVKTAVERYKVFIVKGLFSFHP